MSTEDGQFEFPKIYSFPPLYTKQPNLTVLTNQLDSWMNIILEYSQFYKINTVLLTGQVKHSQIDYKSANTVFENKTIDRSITDEFKLDIFKHMITKKKASYINSKQKDQGIYIYYRSLTEWSDLLYSYIDSSGQLNSILTIYELTKSELLLPDLRNLDESLLIKIIKEVLVKRGKAQILLDDNGEIGGVKIV